MRNVWIRNIKRGGNYMEIINESIEVSRLFQEVMSLFRINMKKIIERTGMTAPQGMVIGLLHKNKKMKVTELSKQLHLPNSTVSGIIDKLEEQDAVIRERSEDDKRVVYVSISPNSLKCIRILINKLNIILRVY